MQTSITVRQPIAECRSGQQNGAVRYCVCVCVCVFVCVFLIAQGHTLCLFLCLTACTLLPSRRWIARSCPQRRCDAACSTLHSNLLALHLTNPLQSDVWPHSTTGLSISPEPETPHPPCLSRPIRHVRGRWGVAVNNHSVLNGF